MAIEKRKYEAPDGGWGWFVVLAFALNNFITIPILQGFGLTYKDEFQKLGISVTDATVITNVNSAFGMIVGLANGPLIRTFGYRKVAIAGAIMYACGVMATSFARTFAQFIIFYGMISSYGMGLSMLAYGIALNTYFQANRSLAVSTYMTITALGPILIPPIQSILLSNYGAQGTMLIFGGLSLNSLIGALLLQPVKWHSKKFKPNLKNINEAQENENVALCAPEQESEKNNLEHNLIHISEDQRIKKTFTASNLDYDAETASIYGYETPMSTHRSFTNNKSSDAINLGSSIKIFDDDLLSDSKHSNFEHTSNPSINTLNKEIILKDNNDRVNIPQTESSRNSKIFKLLRGFVHLFDLNLLRDPMYLMLMFGMSFVISSEINFSLLTPFILSDMALERNQIAVVMSVIGTGDLIFRGLSALIGKWIKTSFRIMYLSSLILLIISRSCN